MPAPVPGATVSAVTADVGTVQVPRACQPVDWPAPPAAYRSIVFAPAKPGANVTATCTVNVVPLAVTVLLPSARAHALFCGRPLPPGGPDIALVPASFTRWNWPVARL